MPRLPRALLVLSTATAPLSAQSIVVEPMVGWMRLTPLFEHETPQSIIGIDGRAVERLSLHVHEMPGMRVVARLPRGFVAYAEGSGGGAEHRSHFRAEGSRTSSGRYASVVQVNLRGGAHLLALGIGAGRRFVPRGRLPSVEVTLGASLLRARIRKYSCADPFEFACEGVYRHVARRYDVPSATAGLALQKALAGRVELQVRGAYSVGRADTRSHHVDLLPALDRYEAPRSQRVDARQLAVGLVVRL
jgi:hypothetical protein